MIKSILFISLLFSSFACRQHKGEFRSVSVATFDSLISYPEVQRLDVRTLGEYSEEHIPGSIHLNVSEEHFEAMADSVLRKEYPVALYCRSGRRSLRAADILSAKGYTVYNLSEGIIGWKRAGKPTEK